MPEDLRYMQLALALGRRGQGRTWPNPAVGAVIVKDGVIVGRGWTQPGGRPHAEPEALRAAGSVATARTSVVLDDFSHGLRDWYVLNAGNLTHQEMWTRKVTDPLYRAPVGARGICGSNPAPSDPTRPQRRTK